MTEQESLLLTKYDLLFEARLTKVETTMDEISKSLDYRTEDLKDLIKEVKADLRWMFGIMLGFSGIMLGLMAKGFHWFA
jgi:putative ribosome biogenesis GTPase RsgA